MLPVPTYLRNYQAVVDAFGYWPDFHDSPVRRFRVEGGLIELEVEAWEMHAEVDARGHLVLGKRHYIGFEFRGVLITELEQFIPENILFELRFSSEEERRIRGDFEVVLDSAMGSDLCGRFTAKMGEVCFVRPVELQDHEGGG